MRQAGVLAVAATLGLGLCLGPVPAANASAAFGSRDPAWQAYYTSPHNPRTWPAFCAGGGGRVVASADNVPACGPKGGTAIEVPGGISTPGFQCVELSDRFLFVTHRWSVIKGDGAQVARRYAARYGARLVQNGTRGVAPHVGDVMSFSTVRTFDDTGHTGVVVASDVNATGDGTFELLSQNIGKPVGTGNLKTFKVLAWRVPPVFGFGYSEWIQSGSATGGQPPTGPTSLPTSWSISHAAATGTLSAVVMTPSHGWAVGSTQAQGVPSARTLVERYSSASRQWTPQASPDIGRGPNALTAVAGTDQDAWAVGHYESPDGSGGSRALALHWNGARWLAQSPLSTAEARLTGVVERSPHDVWAVGEASIGGWASPLAVHWNGSRWTTVGTPRPASTDGLPPTAVLNGVSAVPRSSTLIAVGEQGGRGRGSGQPFALRWTGTSWRIMGTPTVRNGSGALSAVAASAHGVVWAVGSYETSAPYPLVLRLAGSYWVQERVPLLPNGYLTALATTATGSIWVAGSYQPAGAGWPRPLALYGSGSHWANTHASSPPIGSVNCAGITDGYQSLNGIAVAIQGLATYAVGYHDRICGAAREPLIEQRD